MHKLFFADFWGGQQGLKKGFQAHFSCGVSGDFMFKNYVLYVNGWLVLKYLKSHNATMTHCKPLSYQYSQVFLNHFHMKVIESVFLVEVIQ